jgi:hypothetical protein
MSTDQTLPLPAARPQLPETPMEIGPWGMGEPLLPARHVVIASLVLVVVTLVVLAVG